MRFSFGKILNMGKRYMGARKRRIAAGLLLLIAELFLFFHSGVMLEERVSYHTGEGSFGEALTEQDDWVRQKFMPQYPHLASLSFLMDLETVEGAGGEVSVTIDDGKDNVYYRREIPYADVADGRFTDVPVELWLKPGTDYYLDIYCVPSELGEYPQVGVCGSDYYLPENQKLVKNGTELPDMQLVSRYVYEDVMPRGKALKIILLCLLTAYGVMFGIPKNKYIRRIAGVAILAVLPYLLGRRLEMLTYDEMYYLPIAIQWNVGIMYVIELLILVFTHSIPVTAVGTNLLLTGLYTANYFVNIFRGAPLRPSDLTAVGTAVQVAGAFEFTPNDHLAFAWAIALLLAVFAAQTGVKKAYTARDRKFWIRKAAVYAATTALTIAGGWYGLHLLLDTDMLTRAGFMDEKELTGINRNLIYAFDGYLVGGSIDYRSSRISRPEGYSEQAVREILEPYSEEITLTGEETGQLPHVIMIMNESLADLRVYGKLQLNKEYLPFINSLEDNTVRGYVSASVFGGGTANSEFEALTGCTTAFLPSGYYPYQQGVNSAKNSLVSQFEKYGYTSYSMHPAPKTNWSRGKVYSYLGFDHSLWKPDFDGAEEIHSGVSDAETYNRIISLYENRDDAEKLFILDVTIQNHGGYNRHKVAYEIHEENMQSSMLDEYLSLAKLSDAAFEDLVRYFEGQDEKVIICMFGDHHPFVTSLLKPDSRGGTLSEEEQRMNRYRTPFVIWANYDIEESADWDISMNYLGGLLEETAGVPCSPYFAFLSQLRENYPIITVNGYVDAEGRYHNWNEEDVFGEYRILQYNYLYDDSNFKWAY